MRWGLLGREGWLWGSACWSHLDPNLWCLHSGGSSCSRRPIGSQTHFAGDTVGPCTPDLQPVVGGGVRSLQTHGILQPQVGGGPAFGGS